MCGVARVADQNAAVSKDRGGGCATSSAVSGEMGVLRRVFDAHGQLCASRPWEVIIATLTVMVVTASLSLFAASNKICDWNYRCEQTANDDHVITTVSLYCWLHGVHVVLS